MKAKNTSIQIMNIAIKSGEHSVRQNQVIEVTEQEYDVLHRIYPGFIKIEEEKIASEPAPIKEKEEIKNVKSKKSRK